MNRMSRFTPTDNVGVAHNANSEQPVNQQIRICENKFYICIKQTG
jgi:hypothetical protein